ncbi:DUF4817 domain-containing protein [Trichonephila clavipes]|nr:DUF4817 domain-containing protein [Trichonephila clavipes]
MAEFHFQSRPNADCRRNRSFGNVCKEGRVSVKGIFVFAPVLASNKVWSRQQCDFAVKEYFSDGRSMIAEQHAFRRHFDISLQGRVSDLNSVLMWLDIFRLTGNASKGRKGPPKTVKTP